MKKLLAIFLFTALAAIAQNTTLQKTPAQPAGSAANKLTDASKVIIVGDGGSITATGTGVIVATGAPPTGAAGGALAGTYPNPSLAVVNATPGTFAGITTNNKGLVTTATALTTLAGYGITDGVNAITNDTNVTGSIAGHTLTLGWTGALSLARGGTGQSVSQSGNYFFLPSSQNYVFEGDSLTAGNALPAGQDYPTAAMLLSWFSGHGTKYNVAIGGSKLEDLISRYTANVYPRRPTGSINYSYLFVGIGTNNYHLIGTGSGNYASVTAFMTALEAYWAQAKADGFKVVAMTIPTDGNGAGTFDIYETYRLQINALIMASNTPDYKYDLASRFPDNYNSTFFISDHVHLTYLSNQLWAIDLNNQMIAGGSFPAQRVPSILPYTTLTVPYINANGMLTSAGIVPFPIVSTGTQIANDAGAVTFYDAANSVFKAYVQATGGTFKISNLAAPYTVQIQCNNVDAINATPSLVTVSSTATVTITAGSRSVNFDAAGNGTGQRFSSAGDLTVAAATSSTLYLVANGKNVFLDTGGAGTGQRLVSAGDMTILANSGKTLYLGAGSVTNITATATSLSLSPNGTLAFNYDTGGGGTGQRFSSAGDLTMVATAAKTLYLGTGSTINLTATATSLALSPNGTAQFNFDAGGAGTGQRLSSGGDLTIAAATGKILSLGINSTYNFIANGSTVQISSDGTHIFFYDVGGSGTGQRFYSGGDLTVVASGGKSLFLGGNGAVGLTLSAANAATFASTITTAAPTAGDAGAWKLGAAVTGTALLASTTTGVRINIGGTDYTLAVLTTNP